MQTLLNRRELALDVLVPGDPDRLEAPVRWAHSSDLPDPTPFLGAGQVLLTTGTQFDGASDAFATEYVARLVAAGVVGLGFGTEVIRAGTPEPLVAACGAHGLPLFEVPYRTPFIAIARLVADLVAEDTYARQAWALAAQRAISLAALRPDGLSAILAELSQQLGAWVGLIDAGGALDREFPPGGLGASVAGSGASGSVPFSRDAPPEPAPDAAPGAAADPLDAVLAAARDLLRRGRRASRSVDAGEPVTLQTLGSGGSLRGVLAIGDSPELDDAGREVVTAVLALAGLALEQHRDLDRARGHLRSGLVRSILAGDLDLAAQVAAEMWGPLPAAPVRVAVVEAAAEHADRLAERLELRADARGGRLFFGRIADGFTVLVEDADATDLAADLAAEFDAAIGLSDPVGYDRIAPAHEQALRAHERAVEAGPGTIVRFEEVSRQGVLAFLARTDARAVALATLDPLVAHDAANGTALVPTVRTWLACGGQFDRAAQELGVHRHTVRARIALAERLLGRDLSGFHAKADLWAALLAVD
ncbi:PucR family transcriptional regulator [Agromyces larvae]|uniref:PucR family transcriptional regulator n=1 Tax=Agromyces larvae TaxID=2929802 RepID=A0ABY4BXH5_9MICO|nr:PucR family transcriptional regulator [Agromyces larvae]UOE43882.1 PucR family transcriptional regulator [Agromyces larvae]